MQSDKPFPSHLMPLDDALACMAQAVIPVKKSRVISLEKAVGHVSAEAVIAPYSLPPFDNTGVDGYAFRHADLAKSNALKLSGASLAGEPFSGTVEAGHAVHIATGAMMPHGADTVAMQEYCRVEAGRVVIENAPSKGENIRTAGGDIVQDAVALPAAHRLRPQDIALAMALGFASINVLRPLRIAIASTGSELRKAGSTLKPGQIIDTNSLMLKQLLERWPVHITLLGALPDNRGKTDAALQEAADGHDAVITSGGVSVGQRDYVRDALQDLGHVHFWKLALRPGKPVMFGQINDCFMLALPGNPVSAMVTFFVMVQPLLQALLGMSVALPPGFPMPLAADIKKPGHLRCFSRARLEEQNGAMRVRPIDDQGSNRISSLVEADGLLDLPAGVSAIAHGAPVMFRPFSSFLG